MENINNKHDIRYENHNFIIMFMLIFWIFGVALSTSASLISVIFAFIFPPYAWIVTAWWIIEIINKLIGI